MPSTRLAKAGLLAGAAGLLFGAACGDGDDDSEATTTSTSTTVADATTTTAASARYTVQSGDTLSDIARRFGTTVDALVEANDIEDPDVLEVGQELEIPPGPP